MKLYAGIVEEILYKDGRPTLEIIVRVPGIHKGLDKKRLPKASPLLVPGAVIDNDLFIHQLQKTKTVYILFENNKVDKPLFLLPFDESYKGTSFGDLLPQTVSLVFDNRDQLSYWLNQAYIRDDGITVDDLQVGFLIFLRDDEEPDYWVSSIPVTHISELSKQGVEQEWDNTAISNTEPDSLDYNFWVDTSEEELFTMGFMSVPMGGDSSGVPTIGEQETPTGGDSDGVPTIGEQETPTGGNDSEVPVLGDIEVPIL